VLTDLGVARLLDEETAARVTPAYVDPTVARGGAVGPASDVFGLAAAAFHALTGVAPWNGATPADVLAVAATGLLPDLDELAPDAPPELRAVIARGLAVDPHDRGPAAAFALDLRHACRPEPVRLAATGALQSDPDGAVPAVELTHQVPGRRPRPAPEVVVPGRRWDPWAERIRSRTGRHSTGGRVRRPRRVVAALLLAGLAAVIVWVLSGGVPTDAVADQPAPEPTVPSQRPASPTSTPAATSPARGAAASEAARKPASPGEWRTVVAALYAARAGAFSSGSSQALDDVYTERSPLRAADAARIADLRSAGSQLRGFAPEVVEVRTATVARNRAELLLVDRWPAYRVVAGGVVQEVPARGDRVVALVLVRADGGWRIDSARLVT
jgi:hypothetical protein